MLNNKKATAAEEAGMTVRQRLRQKRELEEKRKFGLAPLARDEVTGQEISPNVPQLISQAPWYYGATGPTLDHQRQKQTDAMDTLQDQHDKAIVIGRPTNYTAGACGNCGARTHKTSECYKPRRRIGAMHGGKITGVDIKVEKASKTYAQKRDRYAMVAGVDLMMQHQEEEEEAGEGEGIEFLNKSGESIEKRPKLHDIFSAQTAVTGGSAEIKELPKHLQNLDDPDVLFDPKTGSMRGNPNAADPTRTFQGDLQRYRSGDYYTYLESQLRFAKGESSSFVDFKLDEELQRKKKQQDEKGNEDNNNKNSESDKKEETVKDRLLRSLYGESTLSSSENSQRMKEVLSEISNITSSSSTLNPDVSSSSSLLTSSRHPRMGMATRNGHAYVYGSYFDRESFQWGYKCCKRLGKDAEACQSAVVTEIEIIENSNKK